jgi:hypothetical protein
VSTFWQIFFILLVFIPLVMLWIFALVDLFHRKELSGLAKALWVLAILLLPLLGMLIYFIARKPTAEEERAMAEYAQGNAGGTNIADDLERLAALHDKGVLTDEEFATEKAKLLG